jgi:hypothetical protein
MACIVGQLRLLLLGIEVIKVAEELVEPVHGRQRFVAIADVVLAELAGGIAEILEQAANGGVQLAQAHGALGKPTLLSPVRMMCCPVRNAERPAVHDCSP